MRFPYFKQSPAIIAATMGLCGLALMEAPRPAPASIEPAAPVLQTQAPAIQSRRDALIKNQNGLNNCRLWCGLNRYGVQFTLCINQCYKYWSKHAG